MKRLPFFEDEFKYKFKGQKDRPIGLLSLAELAGVNYRSCLRWANEGRLPIRKIGKFYYIWLSDLVPETPNGVREFVEILTICKEYDIPESNMFRFLKENEDWSFYCEGVETRGRRFVWKDKIPEIIAHKDSIHRMFSFFVERLEDGRFQVRGTNYIYKQRQHALCRVRQLERKSKEKANE